MADRTESVILDVDVDTTEAVESIKGLTEANKALRKERESLNIATAAGQKRAQEINKQIDANTDKIKANVSAIEQQRMNIGNYRSVLDGMHPALGKVGQGLEAGTQGLKAMTKQALQFIATPIGAILAAIVAVFMLLKTAISSNNELLDKFENVTNAITTVLQVLINRVGKLGEAFIAFVSGDFDEAFNKSAEAVGGLGDALSNAVKEGQELLDMSRDLEDAQRNLTVATAKQENVIKSLVVASKNRSLSLSEQEAMLRKALDMERALVQERERIALKDLEITTRQIAKEEELAMAQGETVEEFAERLRTMSTLTDDQVEGIIEKIVQLEQARGSSLAFQEKVENQLTAIAEKRAEALQKQAEAMALVRAEEEANKRIQSGGDVTMEDPAVTAEFQKASQIVDINERMTRDLAKLNAKQTKEISDNAKKQVVIEEMKNEAIYDASMQITDSILGLLDEQSAEYKAIATAQALVSTYTAATKAYEAAFLPIPTVASPAIGVAFAAAAVVQGLANVAKINGIEFAEGGWTGPGGKWDVAGVVHADEYVAPKRVVNNPMAAPHLHALERMRLAPYADGGLVTSSISNPVNATFEMTNAIKNMPAPEVSVKQITNTQKQVRVKQNISKI